MASKNIKNNFLKALATAIVFVTIAGFLIKIVFL